MQRLKKATSPDTTFHAKLGQVRSFEPKDPRRIALEHGTLRAKTSGFTLPAEPGSSENPGHSVGVCFLYEPLSDGQLQLSLELVPFNNACPMFIPRNSDVELDEREGKLWFIQVVNRRGG